MDRRELMHFGTILLREAWMMPPPMHQGPTSVPGRMDWSPMDLTRTT